MSKQAIRQRLLNQRQQLEVSVTARQSIAVQEYVLNSKVYTEAGSLALYISIRNEVCTDLVLQAALVSGKKVCCPRLEDGQIVFVEVCSQDDLQPGRYGVPEPQGQKIVLPESLDLILVPGVAFDSQGHRLGYGFGCYDRVLATCKNAEFIGLAYAFQVENRLPYEEHDIRLDYLATERGLLEFKHKQ